MMKCSLRRPRAEKHASPFEMPTLAMLALAMLGAAAPASAETVATLTGRTSVNHLYYFGGFAISSDEGEDGSPAPAPGEPFEGAVLTALEPRTLAIAGVDHHVIEYLFWDGTLDETWNQSQSYSFGNGPDGATLQAVGSTDIQQTSLVCGLGNCFQATELHRSTNTQVLAFTLSAENDYRLVGTTSGNQMVTLERWNEPLELWTNIVYGPTTTQNTSFDLSGTLSPGLYQIMNNVHTFNGGTDDVQNAWSYTLTLPGAEASAVPLPATWVSLLAGLALIGARRRRQ